MAALLAYEFIEPIKKEGHIERQGRNETIQQRIVQMGLLGVMVLWYNATTKMSEEFSMVLTPILLNIGATAIVTFHIQKTFATAFEKHSATVFAMITAVVVAQITWMAVLVPFSVLTKTMVIASILYVIWNVIELDLKKILTFKKSLPALTVSIIAIIIAISSGPWQT